MGRLGWGWSEHSHFGVRLVDLIVRGFAGGHRKDVS